MKYLAISLLLCFSFPSFSQFSSFDPDNGLGIQPDTGLVNNIWQIGEPQKSVFNMAYFSVNALVTDTVNTYPDSNYSTASFEVGMFALYTFPFFIIEWQQKLDMDSGRAGGWVEFSIDSGNTWSNAFTDTVYNPVFMNMFNPVTLDTLTNGEVGISGTDSSWQHVGLCWGANASFPPFPNTDSIMWVRFVFWSDSDAVSKDGWMLDDISAYPTVIDNLSGFQTHSNSIQVFPNPAKDKVRILGNTRVEEYELSDLKGKVWIESQEYHRGEEIPLGELNPGLYFLKMKTPKGSEVIKLLIE